MNKLEEGTLYLCATPIGNLEDMTLRAIEVLGRVDLIAAEDTRRTRILLSRYDIKTPMMSYREQNSREASGKIISMIHEGKSVALVSDAGTPAISDPGYDLVRRCIEYDVHMEAIPGANAAVTALVLSGLPTRRFSFEGFLPKKKGQRLTALKALSTDEHTMIFYESPNRVLATLKEMMEQLGDRNCAVARELTKKFEEVRRGKISELINSLETGNVKGEVVIVVEGRGKPDEVPLSAALTAMRKLVDEGVPVKEAASRIAERCPGVSKNALYNGTIKNLD